jgi:hypothetical protein
MRRHCLGNRLIRHRRGHWRYVFVLRRGIDEERLRRRLLTRSNVDGLRGQLRDRLAGGHRYLRYDIGRGTDGVHPCDQIANGAKRLLAGRRIAQTMQLVERRLHDVDRGLDVRHRADLEGLEQRLELVAQVAHRPDPGHPRAALQRVQQPTQLDHVAAVRAIATPRRDCGIRLLEQLARLVAEDRRDVRIELDYRLHGFVRISRRRDVVSKIRLPRRRFARPLLACR